jgi:hypothetical protein
VDWVLSDFSPPEEAALEEIFAGTCPAFIEALCRGPEGLLPQWAKKRLPEGL